ncbi:rRNA maturation RNase YbeY [Acidaminobacter hydrogenoformans]|uniref:Endoribonuclease YbeY n=1 Tax=Acidaminobacter hydrogenoformans DSM 2784 TaxID=1120920 RepID=A0A1G5RT41_9FIRM|nr:rRNA maturation RNase YbeY [Acidaminobacter hydrogenoformans]SCZ77156.1 probable rRNA maturation factor [Acidaminobacter hydrogenoformans DSM 2784]
MVHINFQDRQERRSVPESLISKLTEVIEMALEYENLEDYECEVDLTLVDDAEIHQLNLEHRRIDKTTDVLSFPQYDAIKDMEDLPDPIYLGDIVISVERAIEQAKEFNHSFERELCFLTAHSMLHLFGYDHETDEAQKEMRALEESILEELGVTREV